MDLKAREVVTRGLDELGLFDKSGNVWEWCEDWHHSNYDAAPRDG